MVVVVVVVVEEEGLMFDVTSHLIASLAGWLALAYFVFTAEIQWR